jgi:hypothetical protein
MENRKKSRDPWNFPLPTDYISQTKPPTSTAAAAITGNAALTPSSALLLDTAPVLSPSPLPSPSLCPVLPTPDAPGAPSAVPTGVSATKVLVTGSTAIVTSGPVLGTHCNPPPSAIVPFVHVALRDDDGISRACGNTAISPCTPSNALICCPIPGFPSNPPTYHFWPHVAFSGPDEHASAMPAAAEVVNRFRIAGRV